MRNDERYSPKPQSNQLEIFGLGSAGEQDFQEARKNGIAPSLARIMEARYLQLKGAFNKHRSQSDGFSE